MNRSISAPRLATLLGESPRTPAARPAAAMAEAALQESIAITRVHTATTHLASLLSLLAPMLRCDGCDRPAVRGRFWIQLA